MAVVPGGGESEAEIWKTKMVEVSKSTYLAGEPSIVDNRWYVFNSLVKCGTDAEVPSDSVGGDASEEILKSGDCIVTSDSARAGQDPAILLHFFVCFEANSSKVRRFALLWRGAEHGMVVSLLTAHGSGAICLTKVGGSIGDRPLPGAANIYLKSLKLRHLRKEMGAMDTEERKRKDRERKKRKKELQAGAAATTEVSAVEDTLPPQELHSTTPPPDEEQMVGTDTYPNHTFQKLLPGVFLLRNVQLGETVRQEATNYIKQKDIEDTASVKGKQMTEREWKQYIEDGGAFQIPNGSSNRKCNKRRGVPLLNSNLLVLDELKNELLKVGVLEGRTFNDPHGLRRLARCCKGPWHTDFCKKMPENLPRKPLTAWVPLTGSAKIAFASTEGVLMVAELLDIPLGSIVIFEGDVYHRGLSFPEESHALHVYLDVPEVEREKDYTKDGSFILVKGLVY